MPSKQNMKTSPFLTFVGDNCGKAEEAVRYYTSIFPNSEIKSMTKFSEGEMGGNPDLIKLAVFTLNGIEYMASENNFKHEWSFSPGISIFVTCSTESETQQIWDKLSEGGQVMVPLDNYETAEFNLGKMFGWCADKYGVSWQLKLEE